MITLQKLANCRKALEKYPPSEWSTKRKANLTEMLQQRLDYISSEESSDESVLYTHPLPWLKTKYKKNLHLLDKIHYKNLSKKSQGMVRHREVGEPSERAVPDETLQFCVINEEETTVFDSSTENLEC